jgi:hypothetical protein
MTWGGGEHRPQTSRSADRERYLAGHLTAEEGFDRSVEVVPPAAISNLGIQLPLLSELDDVLQVLAD